MHESGINLEHEAFELMEGLNDLMRAVTALRLISRSTTRSASCML